MVDKNDNGYLKGRQIARMTSEDMQQMASDLKKLSPTAKRAQQRKTFTPKKAKKPF